MKAQCYKCSSELFLLANTNVSRQESCPKCHTDLHCCKMCDFYDQKSYNECRESIADRIVDKEKANFCDHFRLKSAAGNGNNLQSALDAANALFKK